MIVDMTRRGDCVRCGIDNAVDADEYSWADGTHCVSCLRDDALSEGAAVRSPIGRLMRR